MASFKSGLLKLIIILMNVVINSLSSSYVMMRQSTLPLTALNLVIPWLLILRHLINLRSSMTACHL